MRAMMPFAMMSFLVMPAVMPAVMPTMMPAMMPSVLGPNWEHWPKWS
jgi:hypothetical protein